MSIHNARTYAACRIGSLLNGRKIGGSMRNCKLIGNIAAAIALVLVACILLCACGKTEKFTVIFQDYDGTVLKTETVRSGEAASAPQDPQRDGYIFVGWDKDFSAIKKDLTVIAEYVRITDTLFTVETVTVASEAQAAEVSISVSNNPGILGMVFSVSYDESVLSLKECQNGVALSALVFQPPSGYDSGCNFVWYGSETGEVTDGEILKLVFSVADDAPAGTYPITLSWNDHDIYDANCDLLQPTAQAGSITVTD